MPRRPNKVTARRRFSFWWNSGDRRTVTFIVGNASGRFQRGSLLAAQLGELLFTTEVTFGEIRPEARPHTLRAGLQSLGDKTKSSPRHHCGAALRLRNHRD